MTSSNVVHQMVDVLQALKTSITPHVTQFKEKPIVRLTHEEYINQELSMFRKIVTKNIEPINSKYINTLRCIISTGLDHQTAMKVIKDLNDKDNNRNTLYESLVEVTNDYYDDKTNDVISKKVECIIDQIIYHKRQLNVSLFQKINKLNKELIVLQAEVPPRVEQIADKEKLISSFDAYKTINYNPDELDPQGDVEPIINSYILEEIPNDGFSIEDTEHTKPKQSFWRCIQDYCKHKFGNSLAVDELKRLIRDNFIIPGATPAELDALELLTGDASNDDTINWDNQDIQDIFSGWLNDDNRNPCIKIFHRSYDIYNKLTVFDFTKPSTLLGDPLYLIQVDPIIIVADGRHYQLVTKCHGKSIRNCTGDYHYELTALVNSFCVQSPLYYDEKGILTKREELTIKRKLQVIYEESRYLGILDSGNGRQCPPNRNINSFKFKDLHVAEKLHVLHRFDIDIPISIDPDNNEPYTTKLDKYIEDIINK